MVTHTIAFAAICHSSTLDQVLPVRYLHIQLTDETGQNLTESVGPLNVKVTGKPRECSFRRAIVDRFDGSYIFRLRPLSACDKVEIEIKDSQGEPLCGDNIVLGGKGIPVLPENCDCPESTLEEWFKNRGCDKFSYTQLNKDLIQWDQIDFKNVLEKVESSWGHESRRLSASLCHYRIRDNQIYRKCYGEYTGFKMFSDEILQSLSRKMVLPDVDFIMNLGDWPLQPNKPDGVPIVSWCGSTDTMDIVMPTYELTLSVLNSMSSASLDIHTTRSKENVPWGLKKPTAVFRGRDSNKLRLDVAKMAQNRIDLIEGGITRYFFFDKDKHPPSVNHSSFYEFFKHKYVISIDGTVAAYRFPMLLSGDSVVLKSDSQYYEHFYANMEANVHYVPFKTAEELEAIIKNLEDKPEKPRKIIENANQFVQDHLQPLHIYCYYVKFFMEYSKKLQPTSDINIDGMENAGKFSSRLPEAKNCRCGKMKDGLKKHSEL
ncbi:hypothetical protein L596_010626 [Steinernema carpocapsae]|uniref:Glycosyl transferase CAP10 domain-containing protein n=1 Tax=Steinernema carpocapsae TaxID=34508 RepID=A0A4U5PJL5_STECR|nr:hypothetical protein L596_010626 [Steinernema carpocapsae]